VSRVGGNFSYLSTQTFFSASHSAWCALSLSKSVYPGLFHSVGFSGVWARTQSFVIFLYFWFFVVSSSDCYGFLGALAFETRLVAPGRLSSYFQENLRSAPPPPHRRWQFRSRLLPDQARHDYILGLYKLEIVVIVDSRMLDLYYLLFNKSYSVSTSSISSSAPAPAWI
jgi:hypothetical protein